METKMKEFWVYTVERKKDKSLVTKEKTVWAMSPGMAIYLVMCDYTDANIIMVYTSVKPDKTSIHSLTIKNKAK